MSLDKLAEDLKNNPSVEIILWGDADPEKYKLFFEHECKYFRKDNPVTGAIAGAITYQITPTNLGTVIKVKCACGKKEDLTDYRTW